MKARRPRRLVAWRTEADLETRGAHIELGIPQSLMLRADERIE